SAASIVPATPSGMSPLPTMTILRDTDAPSVFLLVDGFQFLGALAREVGKTTGNQQRLHGAAARLETGKLALAVAIADPCALGVLQRVDGADILLAHAAGVRVHRLRRGHRLAIGDVERLVGLFIVAPGANVHIR